MGDVVEVDKDAHYRRLMFEHRVRYLMRASRDESNDSVIGRLIDVLVASKVEIASPPHEAEQFGG